jgi:hypothetical protein
MIKRSSQNKPMADEKFCGLSREFMATYRVMRTQIVYFMAHLRGSTAVHASMGGSG